MHVRGGLGEEYPASNDLEGTWGSCMMCSLNTQVILSCDPVQPFRPKLGVLHCRCSRSSPMSRRISSLGDPFRHRKKSFFVKGKISIRKYDACQLLIGWNYFARKIARIQKLFPKLSEIFPKSNEIIPKSNENYFAREVARILKKNIL